MLTMPKTLGVGGPTLAILDAVLNVVRRDLLSQHPPDDDLFESGAPYDAVDTVARLLVRRLDELQELTGAYRHALDYAGVDHPF
jgi:hypothetical protein